MICDGQTDRQTDGRTDARGKTICLPTLSGGRHNKFKNFNRKCDADADVHVNADDRGDYNSSVHFVQAS